MREFGDAMHMLTSNILFGESSLNQRCIRVNCKVKQMQPWIPGGTLRKISKHVR